MADDNGSSPVRGIVSTLSTAVKDSPVANRLAEEAKSYLKAKGGDIVGQVGERIESVTERLGDGDLLSPGLTEGVKRLASGDSPIKAVAGSAMAGVKDKVSGMFGGGGGSGGSGAKKVKLTNIVEDLDIGAPVRMVYDQWTQFADFPSFMKKVESVEQESDEKTNWKAQVFWSHRTWEATIRDQIPDELISWRSKGAKGHVDGSITFHELAPRLTRVMLVLEYHPQGMFERTGNIWRAQGRRARLELNHFRRYVMTTVLFEEEEPEGWRGEIRDGEVVRTHEEAIEEEQNNSDDDTDQADYDEDTDEDTEDEDFEDEDTESEDDEDEYDDQDEDEDEDYYEDDEEEARAG
jgi:Polyketide cyclase / dehydrase and lipid transport